MSSRMESPWLMGSEVVLVVEDDPRIRFVICRQLKRLGYFVLEAENGEHALAVLAIHQGPAHALVTDMVMPRMGGAALIQLLRDAYPKVAILVVSGFGEDLLEATDTKGPGVRYLSKPFNPEALARTLREMLDAA
jgi:two-component system cell cycle sensor histidine kinase/response regulator CckA